MSSAASTDLAPRANLTSVLRCLVLAAISVSACAWLLRRSPALSLWARYLPGTLLGAFVLLAGQTALGSARLSVVRAIGLLLACTLAWRLALHVRLGNALFPWLSASLVGSLGVGVGTVLAWPQYVQGARLLTGLTLTGIAGGVLFMLATMLRLVGREAPWSLVLLWIWQAGLLSVITLCLRRHAA